MVSCREKRLVKENNQVAYAVRGFMKTEV
jgi:hypothetical protein